MRTTLRHLLLLFLVLIQPLAQAQSSVTDGVLINAESMDRDSEKKTVRLDGKVQIVFKGQHISCDHALLDQKTSTIEATGHVVLTNPTVHIEGSKIVFNYKTNTGLIYDGFVQSDQVVFEGSLIEKTSDIDYIATDAEYTACATCPPAWSFSGKRIEAELGGYARISRPVFRIAGFPVLILPGIIVPLKSARQTGLLVPSLSLSTRGGWALSGSFFWALSKSQDVTFTLKNYEYRGPKIMEDYRFVLSETSRGQLTSAAIKDRQMSEVPSDFTRWFVAYDHHFELPDDYTHRVNSRNISDLRYIRDFPDEIQGYGDPALENRMSLTKNSQDVSMSAEVDLYKNILKTYPLADNDDAVHRFPDLKYSFKETQLFNEWGPWFHLDLNYVNFARENYSYDDLRLVDGGRNPIGPDSQNVYVGPRGEILRDASFNASCGRNGDLNCDLIRTGQRLDIRPSFSYPFQIWKTLDVLPTVQFRETQYHFDVPRQAEENGFPASAARRYLETGVAIKTEMNHVFGDLTNPRSQRWKHSIQPEVAYSNIPWMRQPRHNFFGDFSDQSYARINDPISNADVDNPNHGLQFDYIDRTFNKNVVEFSLTNYLVRKSWSGDSADYRRVALFRLSQSYDFLEAQSRLPQPWSPITALLDVRFDHFETSTTSSYNGYSKVTNTSSRLKYLQSKSNFFQLSYTRNTLVTPDNRQLPESLTENIGVGAGIDTEYFGLVGELDYSNITYKIRSWKYDLYIRPPGHCWLIKFSHNQVLGGDPTISGSLDFDFGGEKSSRPKSL